MTTAGRGEGGHLAGSLGGWDVTRAGPHVSSSDGPTVLLAEDDPDLRALIADGLRGAGYHVVEVADGGRLLVALSRAVQDPSHRMPDIVVSDIQMPVVTGLAMAATLRGALRDLPIVLITAFPTDEVARRAEVAGARLLAKPFALEQLVEVVRVALRSGRSGTLGRGVGRPSETRRLVPLARVSSHR